MGKNKDKEMTKDNTSIDFRDGRMWSKILLFAIPLAATSVLQQLFNAADTAVAGHFAGNTALAAVGANAPMINLLVNLFVGLSVGTNAVISIYLGRNDKEGVSKAVHTSMLVAIVSGFVLLLVGEIMADFIMDIMSMPENILDEAEIYFRLYFLGMPFILVYNFSAAIYRSKGDTRTPLIVLIIAGCINVGLNLLLVIVFQMGVSGVAIATVVSNALSSIILMLLLRREQGALHLSLRQLRFHGSVFSHIARIGVPAGLQGAVYSISNVCIQSALNQLGSEAVAGSAAALNFEFLVYFILNAFSQSCITFIGQNYGAGDSKRCRQAFKWALLLGEIATMAFTVIVIIFRERLCQIFTNDPESIRFGCERLCYIMPFQFLNAATDIISGALRGLEKSILPTITCVFGICGVRIAYLYTLYPAIASFRNLMLIYPVTWVVTIIPLVIIYLYQSNKILGQI